MSIRVTDGESGQPLAVRMHLKNPRGRTQRAGRTTFWHDHFVFDGQVVLKLPSGRYTFAMEHGPEYRQMTGYFIISNGAKDSKDVKLRRFVNMKSEGWWSGDLVIHRQPQDMRLLMLAEDLHVAPVITWFKDKNLWASRVPPNPLLVSFDQDRYYHLMAGGDQRTGGTLMYFNLHKPLALVGAQPEFPPPAKFLRQAHKQPGGHVDIGEPFGWNVPVWVASGMVDSIGLAHHHMLRDGVRDNEDGGRPRDRKRYPGRHGNARWTEQIYYHLLNCGLQIPPSAGSASGLSGNPVGYNRVYVHVDGELTYQKWWEGLRSGRVVVTNGPLLRPSVRGYPPGHVFQNPDGEHVEFDIHLKLSTRDKIEYLEIVKDGRVAEAVRLEKWAENDGRLPKVRFDRSGWFLVRAVSARTDTYRFASTGPYYVHIGQKPRISKSSAQFFLDWVYERVRQIRLENPQQRAEVIKYHRAARDYWQRLVDQANAE